MWAFALVMLTLLPACSKPLFTLHRVERHADAGSTHVAVTLVAPWDEFIDDLQPKFEMSGPRSLDMVVPDTLFLDEKIFDLLGARLKTAPPRTSITETVTEKEATGAAPTRSSEVTTKKESGDVSRLKAGEPLTGTRKAADLPTVSKTPGMDPMLRHWAALALFQEVRLLNRYVQRAALRYGYRPYVVRLQVSVMPAARNEPYDAYATLSFFNFRWDEDRTQAGQTTDPHTGTPQTVIQRLSKSDVDKLAAAPTKKEAFRVPYVIPLLVTDNLEAAGHSRTVDTVRQFGLALSVLVQGFSASAEVERLLEELKSVLGRDLNSLLTVARLSDNSIRVRLGALGQAEARYAMVPRTHNVTLLLVAKEHADPAMEPPPPTYRPTIQLYSKTSMVDAERGKPLAARTPEEQRALLYRALMDRVTIRNDSGKGPTRDDWITRSGDLLTLAQGNRYEDFLELIHDYREADAAKGVDWVARHPQVLWIDLVSLMIGSQFSAASFDLPYRPPADLPLQDAVMVDDGESQAVVTLGGGHGLASHRLSAELTVLKAGKPYKFRPERVAVSDGGREIALVFPSLAAYEFSPKADGSELSLQVTAAGDSWARDGARSWPIARVLYRKDKEKADPGFSLVVLAGAVIANKDGKGSLQVHVTVKTASRVLLSVAGADVTGFTADPTDAVSRDGTRLALSKTAVLTLTLQNLDVATPVSISAKNEKDVAHDPIVRHARRGQ